MTNDARTLLDCDYPTCAVCGQAFAPRKVPATYPGARHGSLEPAEVCRGCAHNDDQEEEMKWD